MGAKRVRASLAHLVICRSEPDAGTGLDELAQVAPGFFAAVAPHRRTIERMVPVGANGQPAWGEYVRDPVAGGLHLVGLLVIGTRGDRIEEITHFDTTTASRLGLPRTLD